MDLTIKAIFLTVWIRFFNTHAIKKIKFLKTHVAIIHNVKTAPKNLFKKETICGEHFIYTDSYLVHVLNFLHILQLIKIIFNNNG